MKQKIEFELSKRQVMYIRNIAFNRFLDNVEKALRGDKEARGNLLFEDLPDMREYVIPIIHNVRDLAVLPERS